MAHPHASCRARGLALLAAASFLAGAAALPARAQQGCLSASIDGDQVVPPTGSPGTGTGRFVIDTLHDRLTWFIHVSDLAGTETAAHIHGPGFVGQTILVDIGVGSPKVGRWDYPEIREAHILGGRTYVNIHTSAFPSGEIQGDILVDPSAEDCLAAVLEPAAPSSQASGLGSFFIDPQAGGLVFVIDVEGLAGAEISAAIRGPAPPGGSGPILHRLPAGSPKIGAWRFPPGLEQDILAGRTYVEVATDLLPAGELRGWIRSASHPQVYCEAKRNSQGCTPAISWRGSPSLSGADDFTVGATGAIGGSFGFLVHALAPDQLPFAGGTRCVASPAAFTAAQPAAGAPPPGCTGRYEFPLRQAFFNTAGLEAGDYVYAQIWTRDSAHPDGTGAGLTDALVFTVLP